MVVQTDVRQMQIQSGEFASLSNALKNRMQELEEVKRVLARQSGFSPQMASLQSVCELVDRRRRSLNLISQALGDAGHCYQSADSLIAGRFAEHGAVRLPAP